VEATVNEQVSENEETKPSNEWDYLSWEFLLGMRAQSMGRDQNELVFKMRALPAGLVMAYMETDFVLDIGEEECVVRVRGEVPGNLENFLKSEKAATWAIISAYNSYSQERSIKENQHRHRLLQQVLTASGYKFHPAVGRSVAGDWEEPSILALDLSYDMARALGTVFEQNAVVFGERGAVVEMIFSDR
jgi:hypothetical protein